MMPAERADLWCFSGRNGCLSVVCRGRRGISELLQLGVEKSAKPKNPLKRGQARRATPSFPHPTLSTLSFGHLPPFPPCHSHHDGPSQCI